MKYRRNIKNGEELSQLAFGCMRFPKNEDETRKLVRTAVENGVNYFDTAYMYPGNEATLGRALADGLRERVRIATKLPPYLLKSVGDAERLFGVQLERLRTDRVDYYLMHMLTGASDWERLRELGIYEWLMREKQAGRIGNVGFSYHGGAAGFRALIDAEDWDFCMIQLNYYDANNQAGVGGLEYAAAKGIPVMIMEPLRGGWLANKLPRDASRVFERADATRTPAEWALRWLWNRPEVLTVLSGMSTEAALEENLRVAETAEPGALSEAESTLFDEACAVLQAKLPIPCTGCGYCMPCPAGVDIPTCFACRNDLESEKGLKSRVFYVVKTHGHHASLCSKCGRCVSHCPQKIAIPDALEGVARKLDGAAMRPLSFIVRRLLKWA